MSKKAKYKTVRKLVGCKYFNCAASFSEECNCTYCRGKGHGGNFWTIEKKVKISGVQRQFLRIKSKAL